MDYFENGSNIPGRTLKSGKSAKQDRRWTLLFIGNHGKTITLERFKGMVIFFFAILFVALGISAGLFVWNQRILQTNHDLKDELKNLNERLDALRHENDILMTRLVVAESRIKKNSGASTDKSAADELSDQNPPGSSDVDGTELSPETDTKSPAPKASLTQPDSAPAGSGLRVAIENLQISNPPDDNRLRVRFKIKNTSPKPQRVSGHVIVVLKGEKAPSLPIPWMPLENGRPTGNQRGHNFAINYFKTMRVSTRSTRFAGKYQTAWVYVFADEGSLLLEKEFPVSLTPEKLNDSELAPRLHALPAEAAPSPTEDRRRKTEDR